MIVSRIRIEDVVAAAAASIEALGSILVAVTAITTTEAHLLMA